MATSKPDQPEGRNADQALPPFTLGVDIGGTNIKASVLDRAGLLLADQVRLPTPKPATPEAVLEATGRLAARLPPFDRISVGFPGVVKGGTTLTAPNLGTGLWAGFKLIEALASRFGTPVRLLNDAAVQGLGVVEGNGLECVLTLGTGVGCALFRNRRLLLHLELGQYWACDSRTYDEHIGQAALLAVGEDVWNRRVAEAVTAVSELTCCDVLYIGGGNARKITFALPPHVRIVSNTAGITGGVRLWEPDLDELFRDEPMAQEKRA
ncbi:MAG: ROK family protein [Hyphomicrobiaceae bacterium]|nr:MAG: ROK family protein [Hyphomicrobiaceae bacterium]